jgi:hypothetical protein
MNDGRGGLTNELRDLLNSLGVIGPNIRHMPEDRDNPKRSQEDRDLDAVVEQIEPGSVWCVCGRRWPCETKRLVDLIDALGRSETTEEPAR